MSELESIVAIASASVGVLGAGAAGISWMIGGEPVCARFPTVVSDEKIPFYNREEYVQNYVEINGESFVTRLIANVAYPGFLAGRIIHNRDVDKYQISDSEYN